MSFGEDCDEVIDMKDVNLPKATGSLVGSHTDRYKYIRNLLPGETECDMKKDPDELINLAVDEKRLTFSKLERKFPSWKDRLRLPKMPPVDP